MWFDDKQILIKQKKKNKELLQASLETYHTDSTMAKHDN